MAGSKLKVLDFFKAFGELARIFISTRYAKSPQAGPSFDQRRRILFLIDKLTPAGTQTNLLEIVRRLDRSKFQPFVIGFATDITHLVIF